MTGAVDPAPFVRGVAWPPTPRIPHPRADPADRDRLPRDTWNRACLPVGVRLEWVGDAHEVVVHFDAADEAAAFPWRASPTFSVWKGVEQVGSVPADPESGQVRLTELPRGEPVVVHPPEGRVATFTTLEPIGGPIEPAPAGPRWLCYGDSIAEGWVASEPAWSWPAVVGRTQGLDVVNLGYAGAARGEIPTAEQMAELPAALISLAHGTNCWTRTPHSVEMVVAGLHGFLDVIRDGHPTTPVVVVSPIVRPDAEHTPNRLGATLAELRAAMERVVEERVAAGDALLHLVEGLAVMGPELLADGIHPGDDGHRAIAAGVGPRLVAAIEEG